MTAIHNPRPAPTTQRGPVLPVARGPLSAAVLERLRGIRAQLPPVGDADPFGEDLQLALYVCYELHYRGFAGVADAFEWDIDLLAMRLAMEEQMLGALRGAVPGGADVEAEIAQLVTEPLHGSGVSWHLAKSGTAEQFREYIAHRSVYHLKEADPQALVIARMSGAAKAGVVAIEHDEYGAGRAEDMHSQLFANMMRELSVPAEYGALADHVHGTVLAEVNLMSLTGMRRELRAASVGQFAVIELTSSPGSARLVKAARRLGLGPATERYYAEHVEADAVHEQVLRRGVIAPMLSAEPHLAAGLVFGIQASDVLSARFAEAVQGLWEAGTSSLRRGLPLRGSRVDEQ